jgi:YVTN family beta-propeller protein
MTTLRLPVYLLASLGIILGPASAGADTLGYVPNFFENTVSVIDTVTNTEVDADGNFANGMTRIPVGVGPSAVATTPAGDFVYVANRENDSVSLIHTATHRVVATIPVGDGPSGIAMSPDGAFVYVSNTNEGTVSVVDTRANSEVDVDGNSRNGMTRIKVGSAPHAVDIHPNGHVAIVANTNDNTVSIIDTSTHMVASTISVGEDPLGVAMAPDGTFLDISDLFDEGAEGDSPQ